MGRKTTEKFGKLMAEIAAKDAAAKQKPISKIPDREKKDGKYKTRMKPKEQPKRHPSKEPKCCLDKYDNLPKSFKMCIDCPKRNGNG